MKPHLKTTVKISLVALAAIAAAVSLSSCSLQVNPDGSKSGTLDGEGVIRAIEILNQK